VIWRVSCETLDGRGTGTSETTLPQSVAVSGSTGFLGSHLVDVLRRSGVDVLEISRREGRDICDAKLPARLPSANALIHLAAKTFVPDTLQDEDSVLQICLNGTANALEFCRRCGARMILASSYVYGSPQYPPIDEGHPTEPWNPYAMAKLKAEELCRAYYRKHGVRSCILRIFNAYGPGQRDEFLIPRILSGIRRGRIELSDARPKRDFVHVADVVDAFLRCLSHSQQGVEIFNVGSGVSYSVKDVVDIARQVAGRAVRVSFSGRIRPNEVLDLRADWSKIHSMLGWQPRIRLHDGIAQMIRISVSG
jgi:UDP-glucose 4-epimerase